jgi:hypothetical protein
MVLTGVVVRRRPARQSLLLSASAAVVAISMLSCMPVGVAAPGSTGDGGSPTDVRAAGSAPTVAEPSSPAPVRSAESDGSARVGGTAPTPEVDAEPTRIVLRNLGIDLPVVRPARDETYPLCNVAEFLPAYGLPGLPGVTYVYSHARAGMFLPILEASQKADGATLLGAGVDVYTADAFRRHYAITEVHRRVRSFAVVNGLRGDALVLQTSETDHHTGTKLMVVARPVGGPDQASATEARPEARPRVCGD